MRDKIYGVLKELNEKHGKTIIVIEHHTEYIADYCKHVIADAGRRRCVEASHGRSAAPGGRAAGMQHLPAPGYHCRSSDETGRQAAGGTASAHHRRRREKTLFGTYSIIPVPLAEQKAAEAGEPNVQFRDVSIAYRSVKGDDRLVFDGLDLEIRRGRKDRPDWFQRRGGNPP